MELGAKATSGMEWASSDAADSSLGEGAQGVVSFSLELCFRVLYNTHIDKKRPISFLMGFGSGENTALGLCFLWCFLCRFILRAKIGDPGPLFCPYRGASLPSDGGFRLNRAKGCRSRGPLLHFGYGEV